MVVWSSFRQILRSSVLKNNAIKPLIIQNVKFSVNTVLKSGNGHRTMNITPSRWQWHKFKDMLHYYMMVGLIPCSLVVFYSNVFIGPAQLQPIPEGYTPKHWEYYSHPITRFIAQYFQPSPQQEYEKFLHVIFEEDEKARIIALEKRIKEKMAQNQDYEAFFYKPYTNKYIRVYKDIKDEVENRLGDDV